MALFRISVFSALALWLLDWTVKLLPQASWWVPHYTERSLWALPASCALLALFVAMVQTPACAAVAGVTAGGMAANLIDLRMDGVVWNMIPIPFTDGFTCNVADFAIIGGFLALTIIGAIRYIELCRQPA